MPDFEPNTWDVPLVKDRQARLFNRESARLQLSAGVDPRKCLRVGIREGDEQTSLGLFFGRLQRRVWVSPAHGFWRINHDEFFHWPRVRKLHPNFVPLVVRAAEIGASQVEAGNNEAAVDTSWAIDLFVDKGASVERYDRLVSICGNLAGVPSFDIQESHATEIHRMQIEN